MPTTLLAKPDSRSPKPPRIIATIAIVRLCRVVLGAPSQANAIVANAIG